MKKSENKSWTKRITAVVLAACMVLTTPASLLADDMAEEGEVQAAAEDEFTSGDIETESSDISANISPDLRAIGVIVLCGSPSVSAKINALSSV